MEIFGIGAPELLFILVIALIIVGPRDLGKLGRQIGRFLNRLYRSDSWRTLNEASRELRTLPNRLAREAALEELDETVNEIKKVGKQAQQDLEKPSKDLTEGLRAWSPPAPGSAGGEKKAPTPPGNGTSQKTSGQDEDPHK
jgi:sec-independent protein translocase protein TatB